MGIRRSGQPRPPRPPRSPAAGPPTGQASSQVSDRGQSRESGGRRAVPTWAALSLILALGVGGYLGASYFGQSGTSAGGSVTAAPSAVGEPTAAAASGAGHDHNHGNDHSLSGHDATAAGGGHSDHSTTHSTAPVQRPRALVLGGFAAVNLAVVAVAAVVRHRDARERRSRGRIA